MLSDNVSTTSPSNSGTFFSKNSTSVIPAEFEGSGSEVSYSMCSSRCILSGFTKNRHFIFEPIEIKKLRFVNVIVKFNL
jgi:hypothetical protein